MVVVKVAFAYLLALTVANGQVIYRTGSLREISQQRLHAEKSFLSAEELIPVHQLHHIDNQALVAAEESQEFALQSMQNGSHSGPYRFGKAIDAELDLASGVWLDGGNAWFMDIVSESAYSLSVRFDQFSLPERAELYALNPLTGEQYGPFTSMNNKPSGTFAIFPIAGNRLRLELYVDPSSELVEQQPVQMRISRIVHGFRPAVITNQAASAAVAAAQQSPLVSGRSGSCNINVACKDAQEWRRQVRSVAMILTDQGTGYCSGAMLNNGAEDGRQLFLTAYHCVGTKNVDDDMLLFNYEYQHCQPKPSDGLPGRTQSAHGLRKVAQWARSDFSLLEVEERIPESYGVYLAGWSARLDHQPANPVGIHHPSADVKKISHFNGNCSHSTWFGMRFSTPGEDSSSTPPKQDHWRIEKWTVGTTEPGSSGSPLFDGVTGRVVGQLHGGTAACHNPRGYDAYGKFAYSFHQAGKPSDELKRALDPRKRGIEAMDGMELSAARRQAISSDTGGSEQQRVFLSSRYFRG